MLYKFVYSEILKEKWCVIRKKKKKERKKMFDDIDLLHSYYNPHVVHFKWLYYRYTTTTHIEDDIPLFLTSTHRV